MKIPTYSAPVSITLSGDDVALYGRPALMLALENRVVVSESEMNNEYDSETELIYSAIYKEIFGTLPAERKYHVEIPFKSSYRAVQAALIVCFAAQLLIKKHKTTPRSDVIQKVSYSVEKALFGQYSHAQTVCCIQGGLVYYRKEFEFYKTIMKLPMKVPKGFLNECALICPENPQHTFPKFSAKALSESEKLTKRLVFTVSQENKKEWIKSILQSNNASDLYVSQGTDTFEESHNGLTVLE